MECITAAAECRSSSSSGMHTLPASVRSRERFARESTSSDGSASRLVRLTHRLCLSCQPGAPLRVSICTFLLAKASKLGVLALETPYAPRRHYTHTHIQTQTDTDTDTQTQAQTTTHTQAGTGTHTRTHSAASLSTVSVSVSVSLNHTCKCVCVRAMRRRSAHTCKCVQISQRMHTHTHTHTHTPQD